MNGFARQAMLALFSVVFFLPATFANDEKDPVDGLKCFMMKSRDVKGKKVVAYKGADLYLCCSACVRRFERQPKKYEAQANHQLVQTKQYSQNACPLGGGEVGKDSPSLTIGGVVVKFSSEAHQKKVAQLDQKEQINLVFGTEGFKTGKFEAVKKADKKKS